MHILEVSLTLGLCLPYSLEVRIPTFQTEPRNILDFLQGQRSFQSLPPSGLTASMVLAGLTPASTAGLFLCSSTPKLTGPHLQ